MHPRNAVSYVARRRATIGRFLVVSGSAVGLNLLLLYLMVEYMGFGSPMMQNIANAVCMELSIIYNFVMSRAITWSERIRPKGVSLVVQILQFHVAIGITVVLRLVLFPVLQHAGVPYVLNAAIGIGLASIFNFFVYDNLVFKEKARAGGKSVQI